MKKSIVAFALANVSNAAASSRLAGLSDRWMNKANEKLDSTADEIGENGESMIDNSSCFSCLCGCKNANSFEDYFSKVGAQLLVGSDKDTVLQYRYYYCRTLPVYQQWKDQFTPSDGKWNRFKNWTRKQTNKVWEPLTPDNWSSAYNAHWSIYDKKNKQKAWEAHTGHMDYDDMDESSAMKQCGLTWEQYFFLRQLENKKSSNEDKREYGKQWIAAEQGRFGVNTDKAAWDKVAENKYMPEVTDEQSFWAWAGENQRAVEQKMLL